MAKWETCEIVLCRVREYKVKGGFFSTTVIPGIDQWEARKIGVSGSQTIYESEEWQCGPHMEIGVVKKLKQNMKTQRENIRK
jgi:hypothetical protein